VLLAIRPLASISSAVRPADLAVPVLLVISILAFVDLSALRRPLEDTLPMHHVIAPFSFVAPAVRPRVFAKADDVVVPELSLVARVVCPHEDTVVTMLLPRYVGPRVGRTIRPCLDAHSMLLVSHPLAFVDCSIRVEVFSVPVSFAVKPVSLVDIAFAPVFLLIFIIEGGIDIMASDLAPTTMLLA